VLMTATGADFAERDDGLDTVDNGIRSTQG
jgi:hypothetical protein